MTQCQLWGISAPETHCLVLARLQTRLSPRLQALGPKSSLWPLADHVAGWVSLHHETTNGEEVLRLEMEQPTQATLLVFPAQAILGARGRWELGSCPSCRACRVLSEVCGGRPAAAGTQGLVPGPRTGL